MAGEQHHVEDRGVEPDLRFSLANERTFLAWVRTALGLVAAGVAVARFLPEGGIEGGPLVLGLLLVALGAAVGVLSYRRWRETDEAIRSGQRMPDSPLPQILVIGLSLGGAAAAVLLVAAEV